MKKSLRILSLLLVLAMVFTMATACGKEGTKKTSDKANVSGNTGSGVATDYTVSLKTAGGMALSGIDVYVYADSSLSDMKTFGQTDEKGMVNFNLPESSQYAVVLSNTSSLKGYDVKDYYTFDGDTAIITLKSSLITTEDLSSATLKLGDVMYDFTVTTPDGEKITLSKMLQEKKMVLINFWYTSCSWCVTEFPYMEQAYQQYKDEVGIVALDPLGETDAAIKAFPGNYNLDLSFPLAACPSAWSQTFGIQGYPTSVIVDRYGVITLIESGAITSLNPFTSLFETMTADDYQQKLYNSVGELIVNPKPTYEMDTPENIAALLNSGDIKVSYHGETEEGSKDYAWPFIATEKLGKKCLKASNQGIDSSFGVIYADVTLKKGQALGLDYLMSSENGSDTFVIIVDGEDIFTISGYNDKEKWESCYPVVADKDGTYQVALFYLKDDGNAAGDDTVYIKNLRVVDSSKIDTPTYLPRPAAKPVNDTDYEYVKLVFNSTDGYYHVGSQNGPLLLADLMGYTDFSEDSSIWEMAYDGKIVVGGKNYLEELTEYCNYASNAKGGLCTVNKELMELLQKVDTAIGFNDADNNEWLKICKYYEAYGSNGAQLEDPIKGLATFAALTATEGKNVSTNFFYYEQILMPRGKMAKFVPNKSGVYRITSRSQSAQGVDGWIFDKNRTELLVYEHDERMYDGEEVSMVYYMKKGEAYFIDIAFWDVYETGYIYYDIEYMGAEVDHFRLCSPGYFTYDSDETGNDMYHLIAGGIDVVLGSDGIYYEDLGNGKKGSKIYADFYGITPIFSQSIQSMINMGGFDFSKTEDDLYILGIMKENGNDKEKTIQALKNLWGDTYESEYAEYKVDDVFAGKYHGVGKDLTSEIKKYEKQMIKSGAKELQGCVVMTKDLAELLQKLMDKYTFEDVDNAWLKVCYYYDHLGPNG